jgi:hypothetical protein
VNGAFGLTAGELQQLQRLDPLWLIQRFLDSLE